jgi:hypothetical protein
MTARRAASKFRERLHRPVTSDAGVSWCFLILPKKVSGSLPRRGRTTIEGTINGQPFQATLEPDGRLGHWLKVGGELQAAAGVGAGDMVTIELSPIEEPEPALPSDLNEALARSPEARRTWDATTTIARLDWIHWLESAKQEKTRRKRLLDACAMLSQGKKRVCCFDPSGYYSKALSAPEPAPPPEG